MPPTMQGNNLDKAVIDLGINVFYLGQAYVALSSYSVRMLEGILLIGLIRASFDKNKTYLHDEYVCTLGCCPIF